MNASCTCGMMSGHTSGDVGYKIQRELKAGRDAFVFSGTVDGALQTRGTSAARCARR
ncbi:hypothetical protein [Deinococcus sp. Arct2-2]|uniref:hypothetical protein n=1 Tax=Deinococcus sp. Arct2-2 TaxID=2568653 RepID=UPI001454BC41|nr:hypothetical protein [Deinococcus sp. Arct2-2]